MKIRGANALIEALATAGVSHIFSLSGNQIMPIYDACFEAKIKIIHTRHEAAAVYMAEAFAQLTGQVGVALVTAGAGAANAIGPLFTASESETPVLLLTGDSPLSQDGAGAFQEFDQVPMTAPATKHSFRARFADNLQNDIAGAIRTAFSGRPGPVHLALPFDVVQEPVETQAVPPSSAFDREPMHAAPDEASAILSALSQAKRPLVICGPAMNATRFCGSATLSETLNLPVIAMESPRGLSDPSLGDIREICASADLVVNLGKRVDFTLGFGKADAFAAETSWIFVHACPKERDRAHRNLGARLRHNIAADPRDVAGQLINLCDGLSGFEGWQQDITARLSRRLDAPEIPGKITSAQLCAAVQRQIDKVRNPILVCDGGEFGQWAQAACSAPLRIINGISGAIGGGLCYGIAAKAAKNDATVFSLMGDGTVGFHFAEFETAVRERLANIVVIGNDRRWNAEHQIQLRDYGADRLIGCQLSDARYDLAAAALGGHGEYVSRLEELDAALERAVSSGLPACVNVQIEGLAAPSPH